MPEYIIKSPDGRTIKIRGERPPTRDEAAAIFANPEVGRKKALDINAPGRMDIERQLLRSDEGRKRLTEAEGGGVLAPRSMAGLAADITLESGSALGQSIGAHPVLSVPSRGLSIPLGGALFGAGGNLLSQKRRVLAGEQDSIKPGQVLSSAVTGSIPGAPMDRGMRLGQMVFEGAKQGAGGVAGRALETVIDENRLPTGTDLALAGGLPAIGGAVAQRMQASNPALQAAVAEAKAGTGAQLRKTLEKGVAEGYVVPESIVRKQSQSDASLVGDTLESIGGKAAVKQQAIIDNQPVTNRLAKRSIGVAENRDLTEEVLDSVRKESAEPYERIRTMATKAQSDLDELRSATQGMGTHETEALRADPSVATRILSLSKQAAAQVDDLRKARNTATLKFRQYRRMANPDDLDAAKKALESAENLEAKIEAAAIELGHPEMVDELRAARTRIARTYDIEGALNDASGNVNPQKLRAAKNAGRPLGNELETIADFAEAFEDVMKPVEKSGAPGVSALQAGFSSAGLLFGASQGSTPTAIAAGLLPLSRPIARGTVLSGPYQRNFATQIPLSVDARPPLASVATRAVTQEGAQEIAEEAAPKKKTEKK